MGPTARITVALCGTGLLAASPSHAPAQQGSSQLAVTATVVSRCDRVSGDPSVGGIARVRVECGDLPYRVTVTPAGASGSASPRPPQRPSAEGGATRLEPGPHPGVVWVTVEF